MIYKWIIHVKLRFLELWLTHHERINKKVIVLEGIESRRGGDSIFVIFAQLHCCHHCSQSTKHQIVENFHFWFAFWVFTESVAREKEWKWQSKMLCVFSAEWDILRLCEIRVKRGVYGIYRWKKTGVFILCLPSLLYNVSVVVVLTFWLF